MKGKLTWLAKGRERKILELCDAHMKEVVKTVTAMDKVIKAFYDLESPKEEYESVFRSEREADRIKREILEELSREIFHPISRDELTRLVMTADEVAANAKAAAKKLTLIDPKKFCKELREILRDFSGKLVEISNKLYETFVLLEKPKSAIALSHKVEELEEGIDDFCLERLMPKLLVWHKEIRDTGLSFLLEGIAGNMENIADLCEDTSDIIRCIAVAT